LAGPGGAGKKGVAHTFFTTFDKAHSGELVNVLKEAKQEVPEAPLRTLGGQAHQVERTRPLWSPLQGILAARRRQRLKKITF